MTWPTISMSILMSVTKTIATEPMLFKIIYCGTVGFALFLAMSMALLYGALIVKHCF